LANPSQPLSGKRIVVTRAPDRSQELIRRLQDLGAEVCLLPMIGAVAPEDEQPLKDAICRLEEFDAILFVSRTAVEETYKRAGMLGKREVLAGSPERFTAVVGPATARAAREHGIRVDYVSSGHTGEGLVREVGKSLAGRSVFLPRSDRGDRRLGQTLREAGANVKEVVAYRTVQPEPPDPELIQKIRRAEIDVIIFASPSAIENLSETIEPADLASLAARVNFAAIGPTTAEALRKRGIRVEIIAKEPSSEGLTQAIMKYYEGSERDAEKEAK